MDINMRRIKNTPYKVVLDDRYQVVGVFEYGKFVDRHNMSDKLKHALAKFHADTLTDRLGI
jgi:hypothetical protein